MTCRRSVGFTAIELAQSHGAKLRFHFSHDAAAAARRRSHAAACARRDADETPWRAGRRDATSDPRDSDLRAASTGVASGRHPPPPLPPPRLKMADLSSSGDHCARRRFLPPPPSTAALSDLDCCCLGTCTAWSMIPPRRRSLYCPASLHIASRRRLAPQLRFSRERRER